MSDWFETLHGLWQSSWALMDKGVPFVALATLGPSGPEQRTVGLRHAIEKARILEIHTDIASTKIEELRANACASILYWNEEHQLQVRLTGRTVIETETEGVWATLNQDQRENYGVNPPPGTAITASGDYSRIADALRFAILRVHVSKLDIVHLSPDFHRRACFDDTNHWKGQWLAP